MTTIDAVGSQTLARKILAGMAVRWEIVTLSVLALLPLVVPSLGGAASVIYGLYINTISFQMGFQNGLYAFTAAVLGGIGSIPGAVVGGMVIGLVRALSSAYVGERWTGAIVFAILIVILVFRPEGLLGRGTKEKV